MHTGETPVDVGLGLCDWELQELRGPGSIMRAFVVHFLCASHYSESSTHLSSFHPHSTEMKNLPQVTQLVQKSWTWNPGCLAPELLMLPPLPDRCRHLDTGKRSAALDALLWNVNRPPREITK